MAIMVLFWFGLLSLFNKHTQNIFYASFTLSKAYIFKK